MEPRGAALLCFSVSRPTLLIIYSLVIRGLTDFMDDRLWEVKILEISVGLRLCHRQFDTLLRNCIFCRRGRKAMAWPIQKEIGNWLSRMHSIEILGKGQCIHKERYNSSRSFLKQTWKGELLKQQMVSQGAIKCWLLTVQNWKKTYCKKISF